VSDWLHNLPLVWMALVVFAATYLIAAGIYLVIAALAVGARARSFTAISPGMLSPMGVLFGLFVAFIAAQVWSDNDHASAAVNREASALRSVELLAARFPGEPEARLRALLRDYIADMVTAEWPAMARQSATLRTSPPTIDEALRLTLALIPASSGQQVAQREMAVALENLLDARRQRVLLSRSQVNGIKWLCLMVQAACVLLTIALVQSGDRLASLMSLWLFASGAAVCVLVILAHDRPFTGQLSVGPGPLLQVMPSEAPVHGE
jgi:hypothetical protein